MFIRLCINICLRISNYIYCYLWQYPILCYLSLTKWKFYINQMLIFKFFFSFAYLIYSTGFERVYWNNQIQALRAIYRESLFHPRDLELWSRLVHRIYRLWAYQRPRCCEYRQTAREFRESIVPSPRTCNKTFDHVSELERGDRSDGRNYRAPSRETRVKRAILFASKCDVYL